MIKNFKNSATHFTTMRVLSIECPFLDPQTEFVSLCTGQLAAALVALVVSVPLIYEGSTLLKVGRAAHSTAAELVEVILALASLVIWLASPFVRHDEPTLTEWVAILGAVLVVGAHYLQNGRVRVGMGGLGLYWLGEVFVSISLTADTFLRHDTSSAKVYGAQIFISAVLLILESTAGTHTTDLTMQFGDRFIRSFESVTIFDQMSMAFVTPLMKKGTHEKLERKDIPLPFSGLNAAGAQEQLQHALDECKGSRYLLLLGIFKTLKWELAGMLIIDIFGEFIWLFSPLVLSLTFKSLQGFIDGNAPLFPSIFFGTLVGVMPLAEGAFLKLSQVWQGYIDVISRVSVTGAIYRKALTLAPTSRAEYDSGKIMNMVNVDTNFILYISDVLIMFVTCPLMLILALWQLWLLVGISVAGGAVVLALFSAFTGYTSRLSMPLYPAWMAAIDNRTKASSNVLRNIKSLKLYSWEQPYHDRIVNSRDNTELPRLRGTRKIEALNSGVWSVSEDIVAVAIFIVFLWWHQGSLSADIVFPTLLLLTIVSIQTGLLAPMITDAIQILTSNKRISEFLSQPDHRHINYFRHLGAPGEAPGSIDFQDAMISWSDENAIALNDISFQVGSGDFVCVTGRVGAGKTALLKSILGELAVLKGSVNVIGKLAYCGQEPWLQNGTLQENVVFGQEFDQDWYKEVLDACALTKDIEQMPMGHATEVGERGISLSGGQKARVSLARAIYSRADIYILDDVLSAVDEHVAKHLINRIFSHDGLLASRTIVLATNYIKVLGHASLVLAIQDKRIIEQTTIENMLKNQENSDTFRLIKTFNKDTMNSLRAHDRKHHVLSNTKYVEGKGFDLLSGEALTRNDAKKADEENQDETNRKTSSLAVYGRYLRVLSIWQLSLGFCVTVFSVICVNAISYWLGVISDHRFTSLGPARWYIIVYLVIALLSCALTIIGYLWFLVYLAIQASSELHSSMLWRVMRAPMGFFDATPLGRVINRFTGDINQLDASLPQGMYSFMRSVLNVVLLSIYIVIASPITVVVMIPLGFVIQRYRLMYVPTSRQISRLVKAANSPLLSQIEDTLRGVSVVHGFGRHNQFIELYDARQNYWLELRFLQRNIQGWLSWRIQCSTATLRLVTILSSVALVARGKLSVAAVGVIMQFVSKIGMVVGSIISQLSNLEVAAVALDRIVEYIDMDQEAQYHIEETAPQPGWPEEGAVKFFGYSCRYKPDSPDVLKKLGLDINPSEKIGIVGRTGSGKSTLTLALFRLIEASDGHIEIDNKNTALLGVHDLRSHLSIIPQDAQIFNGTVRENLDPFGNVADADLWQILELCHLKAHFKALEGLDTALVEGGENLSRGQCQLVCLGRALVHETKILVLDEATASVDVETDHVLQQTIRSEFRDRTIFTVAHRLNTIMDSDRIIVLDHGQLVEFDTPNALLKKKGAFWSLVNAEQHGELQM